MAFDPQAAAGIGDNIIAVGAPQVRLEEVDGYTQLVVPATEVRCVPPQ